jgi:hypothetical protein
MTGGATDSGPGGRRGLRETSAVLGSEISRDRAGWWVELTVGFEDEAGAEVVRRRIGPYLTERAARVAVSLIARAAGREAPPPTGR